MHTVTLLYRNAVLTLAPHLTFFQQAAIISDDVRTWGRCCSHNFDLYYIDRAQKLLTLIEKAMGKPVSDKNAETTIEQFGSSLANS